MERDMTYIISNEREATSQSFTSKRAAYKAMTTLKRLGVHFTARVHDEHGCRFTGVDAIRYIKA